MQIPSCEFHGADSLVRILLCGSIVQTPLCGFHQADSTMRISSCRFYCAGSFVRIPLFPSRHSIERIPLSAFHRAHSIDRIPSRAFYRANADFILRILSCGFHRADSIVRIPSYGFYCINSIQTPLCGCYRAHSIIRIPCVHSIVCIPSCAFYCVHSVVCIPTCDRRRREEVTEDGGAGTLAHCIHICICSCSWHQPGCINWECIEWESID